MGGGIKSRLLEYLHFKRISQKDFCINIGVSPAYVSNMVNGIGPDKICKIMEVYPDLNIEWLHNGTGKMIKGEDNESEKTTAAPADCPVGVDGNIIKVISGMQDQINIWIKERDYWKDKCLSKDEQIQELKAELKELESMNEGKYGKGKKSDDALVSWEKLYGSNMNGKRLSNSLGFRNGVRLDDSSREIVLACIKAGSHFVEEDGIYKFEDFLYEMIDALGDGVKPYVKIVYAAIRQNSDDATYEKMDDENTVRNFDVENYNIDEMDEEETAEEETSTGESASAEAETETK